MHNKHAIHIKGKGMKTYVFKVVIEPDEDRWSAQCPALLTYSAVTWGDTQEEALKHIQEVVQMVVAELGSVSDLHLMGLNPQAKFVPIDEQTDDKIMHLN